MDGGTVKDRRKSTSECSCSDTPDVDPEMSGVFVDFVFFFFGWVHLIRIRVGLDGQVLILISEEVL